MSIQLLTACLLLFVVASSACYRDQDCRTVSINKAFVECVNSRCQCLTDQGFSGLATLSSKCTCNSPNQVFWDSDGAPYCIQLPNAVAYDKEQARNEILTQSVKTILNMMLFPNAAVAMASADPVANSIVVPWVLGITNGTVNVAAIPNPLPSIVSPDVRGRMDPLGEFYDYAGFVDLWYGQLWFGGDVAKQVEIKSMTVEDNKVTTRFRWRDNGVVLNYDLMQTVIWTFNDANKLVSLEGVTHNTGWAVDVATREQFPNGDVICTVLSQITQCLNPNSPLFNAENPPAFQNFTDCKSYFDGMIAADKFGSFDNARTDSIVCRVLHLPMAVARPVPHCAIIGPSGANVCVPHTYADYFNVEF